MNNKPKIIEDKPAIGKIIENRKDAASLVFSLFKNLIGFIPAVGPVLGAGTGVLGDYYNHKVTKKREEEVSSCIENINKRLAGVEIKQEAVDYVEKSLVFRLEEITIKLITNPDKDFDELIADFVAGALTDLNTPPETKDLILSTLLNLDSVDIKILKELDRHFVLNLDPSKTNTGVTRDSLYTLLKDSGLDRGVIGRSIQRLQSQYIIQPLVSGSSGIHEVPSAEDLYQGKSGSQFDSPSGFVNTDFGRIFMNFLKIGSTMKGKVGI